MMLDKPDLINKKTLVIVDEMQLLGDKVRGGTLEALLTWIKLKSPTTQIVGLTATIPNIENVSEWLGSEVVKLDRRPVKLIEQIWGRDGVWQINREEDSGIIKVDHSSQVTSTPEVLKHLSVSDYPIIIFCITKDSARALANSIAESRSRIPKCETLVNELDEITESNPITRSLRNILPKGVAFHSADLSLDERRLIEDAYRRGLIDVICATPTLSAGVNLPIKTVIFDSCHRSWVPEYISNSEYMNMAGRAGRRGLQDEGRSILLASTSAEEERYKRYLEDGPTVIESQLTGQELSKVILQSIVAKISKTKVELTKFFVASFHGYLSKGTELFSSNEIIDAIDDLKKKEMIRCDSSGNLIATELGQATASSGVLPDTGRLLFDKLSELSQIFEWSRRNIYEEKLLLLIMACKDLSPSFDDMALLFIHREDRLGFLRDIETNFYGLAMASDLEDRQRSLLSAFCMWKYINNTAFKDLNTIGRYVRTGNIYRLRDKMIWMLQAAASIENARCHSANPELRRWLIHVANRLEYGATDEAVELCKISRFGDVRGVGRTRAQRLAESGYFDLSKLLCEDIDVLSRIVDSTLRATKLKEATLLYLNEPAKHYMTVHINRAVALGMNHRLIECFYNDIGGNFEKSALGLLQTVYKKARQQDIGGDAEPDLAIPTDEGLLVIECKTKKSEEGTVNLSDAFAVNAKAAHLNPVGMVTLGKPKFDNLPIERAINANVTLITHIIFCEAIVRIWENKLDSKKFLSRLRNPGLIDIKDIDLI